MKNLPKIIAILGQTGAGKTALSLILAKKYNGEIINFDSRQVYKEMNIGTAKPAGKWEKNDGVSVFMVDNVPHHLMDIIHPDQEFTVADFKKMAEEKITDILARGRIPFLVGGTGLYFWAVLENLDIPKTLPDNELRSKLEKLTLAELVEKLKEIDPKAFSLVDLKNPRRVLRALEVAMTTGESFVKQRTKSAAQYDCLRLGVSLPRPELYERINLRVEEQLWDGLLAETEKLSKKYFWDLPSMSGIGYRQIGYFLKNEMTLAEAIEILKRDTRHYAKRQETWFKRDKKINWLRPEETKKAEGLIENFLKN